VKVLRSVAFRDVVVESGFHIAEGIAGEIGEDLKALKAWIGEKE
jgi:hypothetical protein